MRKINFLYKIWVSHTFPLANKHWKWKWKWRLSLKFKESAKVWNLAKTPSQPRSQNLTNMALKKLLRYEARCLAKLLHHQISRGHKFVMNKRKLFVLKWRRSCIMFWFLKRVFSFFKEKNLIKSIPE